MKMNSIYIKYVLKGPDLPDKTPQAVFRKAPIQRLYFHTFTEHLLEFKYSTEITKEQAIKYAKRNLKYNYGSNLVDALTEILEQENLINP